ncbi:hypothetical protein NDU88_003349 [Pleurodeles waltl]|uniref:Uncharacterized protein n=1 Tax=Pleurodeles waltl TaxID=8319 RepID=A0AAV7V0C2_PLEWA|nr:hypothetical protein NDU88_003349 [Pleurodeles waltl]
MRRAVLVPRHLQPYGSPLAARTTTLPVQVQPGHTPTKGAPACPPQSDVPVAAGWGCDGAVSSKATPRCPEGTTLSAEGPGDPSGDDHSDPEALLCAADRPEEDRAPGLFKSPGQRTWRQPPATKEVSWRPAEAVPEEHAQLTPREARNQEEARSESGHALESMATPGMRGRRQKGEWVGNGVFVY